MSTQDDLQGELLEVQGSAPLDTPDVTPIQKLAAAGFVLLGSVLGLVNAFGWSTIDATEAAAVTGVYVSFTGVLVVADAVIRHGRSRALINPPRPLEDASGKLSA